MLGYNANSGYSGYSMSNNAVEAYKNGEKPMSVWKKRDIIGAIKKMVKDGEISLQCSIGRLEKTPKEVLKEVCLCWTSCHHTSKNFNLTDFYSLDMDAIEELTDEKLHEMVCEYRQSQEELKQERKHEEKWKCTFLIWSGTRRHPKAEAFTEVGIIRGNWFIRSNGSKKSIYANGVEKIQRMD